jgi:DHA2 family lincomycin resistance protein-like MFS transporter
MEHTLEQTKATDSTRTSRQDLAIIFTMLIACFVVILNETIMNVALPKLMVELSVSASTIQWLATGFMLVMAILIPTTGFLINRFSTRALFITAMGTFSLGTLLCGLAPNFVFLLGGRILQASGTAIMLPLLTTTILALIPPERRGSMMGTMSIVISVAPAIGPTISGIIIQSLSWRYMFFFVLPITLLILGYGYFKLQNINEAKATALDKFSIVLAAMGFGGIVYGFSSVGEGGGSFANTHTLIPLTIGFMSLALFVWRQFTLKDPLLDLRALRYPMFALSVVIMMISMMALFSTAILLPIYLQNVRGMEPLETGLFLLPGGIINGLASPIVGRLFDRFGPRFLVPIGTTLMTVTIWSLTQITAETSTILLLLAHVLFSLGLAMLFTPVFTTGMNQLPRHLHAHGSAIASTLQQVSGAIGTALLVAIMSNGVVSYLSQVSVEVTAEVQRSAQISGLHSAFWIATVIALAAFVCSLFLRRTQAPEGQGEPIVAH